MGVIGIMEVAKRIGDGVGGRGEGEVGLRAAGGEPGKNIHARREDTRYLRARNVRLTGQCCSGVRHLTKDNMESKRKERFARKTKKSGHMIGIPP